MRFDLTLYLVTDMDVLNKKYTINEAVEEAILNGVTMVQLREKRADTKSFLNTAISLKNICSKYNIPFIINDRLDIALATDTDGIHIGQNDMPIEICRKLLGKDKIIGVSCSSFYEAREAMEKGADYLGLGTVFSTNTKTDGKRISLDELKEINEKLNIPVAAIGGINHSNYRTVYETGVSGISVVSAILGSEDIGMSTKEFFL